MIREIEMEITPMRGVVAIPTSHADSASFPVAARLLMLSKAEGANAMEFAASSGASDRVVKIIKPAVEVGSTTGWGADITPDVTNAQNGFMESLRTDSVFFDLLNRGVLRRIPLRTRIVLTTAGATGYMRGEGSARQISHLEFDTTGGLEPREAVGILVVSKELLMLTTAAAQAMFSAELRKAVSSVVDDAFMAIIAAAKATTIASVGTTFNAAREDLKDMLAAISTDATSEMFFISGTGVAKAAATLGYNGVWTFPDMGPQGGSMLKIPCLVTDRIAADVLYLVDASKIAANADEVRFELFKQGLLQMDSAPDSPGTASTVQISLWQRNLVALVAKTYFAAEAVNATCIVELTGVAWGTYGVDSPT